MKYVQMTKIMASADKILDAGKIYSVDDKLAAELLADDACQIISQSQLPKTRKSQRRLMPSSIPDPEDEARHTVKKPVPDDDDDDDEEIEEDDDK